MGDVILLLQGLVRHLQGIVQPSNQKQMIALDTDDWMCEFLERPVDLSSFETNCVSLSSSGPGDRPAFPLEVSHAGYDP